MVCILRYVDRFFLNYFRENMFLEKFGIFFKWSKDWHILIKAWLKVLSILEACFDLISSHSPSMKIQIMGGKITENLGFQSPLQKVKKNFVLFLFIFKFSIKNCISLFLTIFNILFYKSDINKNKHFQHVLFDFLITKRDIKKWLK